MRRIKKETAMGIYHPIVSFSYFIVIIAATMFFMHPIFIGISLMTSIIYASLIDEKRAKAIFTVGIITAISVAVVNVLFVHRGSTILFYLKYNPVTFEALMYGICSGGMILATILWFSSYNEVITSEKFLYIFGKVIPNIALMINMTLRLIPRLIHQIKIIANSQKTVGLDYSSGNLKMRLKSSMRILSILVTWALEDAVETADSMKARGYGLKGRSSFSIFVFTKRDKVMFLLIMAIGLILCFGYYCGYGSLRFYPNIADIKFDFRSIIIYLSFLILGALPSILEILEDRKWKKLK